MVLKVETGACSSLLKCQLHAIFFSFKRAFRPDSTVQCFGLLFCCAGYISPPAHLHKRVHFTFRVTCRYFICSSDWGGEMCGESVLEPGLETTTMATSCGS